MKITRKELSAIITEARDDEVTVRMILHNEERWGLRDARGVDLNKRVVRYDKAKALAALRKAGVIP
jgi:hypothetical protein